MEMQMFWWVTAALLVFAEMILPGVFFVCVGIAAATVGLVLVQAPELSIGDQSLIFAVAGIATSVLYAWITLPRRRRMAQAREQIDEPSEKLVGRRFSLVQPIVNGWGKISVGDGELAVTGEQDAPVGSTVKVTAAKGPLICVAVE